jgi:hypothetical protein
MFGETLAGVGFAVAENPKTKTVPVRLDAELVRNIQMILLHTPDEPEGRRPKLQVFIESHLKPIVDKQLEAVLKSMFRQRDRK